MLSNNPICYDFSLLISFASFCPAACAKPKFTAALDRIKIYPHPSQNSNIDKVRVSYIKQPQKPNWSGIEVNGSFLYNETDSTNFELHSEEENLLIIKILQLAGISMKDFGLAQAAGQKEANDISNEKS